MCYLETVLPQTKAKLVVDIVHKQRFIKLTTGAKHEAFQETARSHQRLEFSKDRDWLNGSLVHRQVVIGADHHDLVPERTSRIGFKDRRHIIRCYAAVLIEGRNPGILASGERPIDSRIQGGSNTQILLVPYHFHFQC